MENWHQSIISIFRSKVNLSEEDTNALINRWNSKSFLKRNEFLVERGQIETRLFFVIEGTMRIYFPNGADEICVGFAHPGNLICSYPSFIRQEPSDYLIQTLSKTSLTSITRSDFYSLFDNHPLIERAWRMLEEEALMGKIERETEMLTFSPEERYNRLIKRSPHIFQLIPRKYIASYLRMTPETLSRIRPS